MDHARGTVILCHKRRARPAGCGWGEPVVPSTLHHQIPAGRLKRGGELLGEVSWSCEPGQLRLGPPARTVQEGEVPKQGEGGPGAARGWVGKAASRPRPQPLAQPSALPARPRPVSAKPSRRQRRSFAMSQPGQKPDASPRPRRARHTQEVSDSCDRGRKAPVLEPSGPGPLWACLPWGVRLIELRAGPPPQGRWPEMTEDSKLGNKCAGRGTGKV